ncbi:MAG: rare lipoprotein [Pseudonocardiales bacterium]|nr:rare lipoprotein [Pseudonocardiales bacterium]
MRPNLDWRAVLSAGALCFAYVCAAAMPAAAPADSQGTTPTATASKVGVSKRRLNVQAGSRAVVRGVIRPAGSTVALQVRRHGRWVTLDRDRTDAQGRYVLRNRMARPMSARARVRVSHGPAGKHGLGRLNVYRHALASWYGPGLYGGHLSCGGRLSASKLGVAHKSLPCGTRVTLRHHGRVLRVPVIDRGPYSGAREFDLTAATARRLKFKGYGSILSTR